MVKSGMTLEKAEVIMKCQVCYRESTHLKRLPMISKGLFEAQYLKIFQACVECNAMYVTDAALFWDKFGRPMNADEEEMCPSMLGL